MQQLQQVLLASTGAYELDQGTSYFSSYMVSLLMFFQIVCLHSVISNGFNEHLKKTGHSSQIWLTTNQIYPKEHNNEKPFSSNYWRFLFVSQNLWVGLVDFIYFYELNTCIGLCNTTIRRQFCHPQTPYCCAPVVTPSPPSLPATTCLFSFSAVSFVECH